MRRCKLSKSEKIKLIVRFCQALSQIKSPEEAAAFVSDLLTESESEMIARRLAVAEKLIEGRKYDEIADKIKVGYGTIARVNEWLTISGQGYRTVIERLEKLPEIETKPVRLSQMERRYPAYYWPQILLKEIVAGASNRQKEKLEKALSQLSSKTNLYKELAALLKPVKKSNI